MISISQPTLDDKESNAVKKVLLSGKLAQGEIVEEFEKRFAEYIGTKYAIATSNGTTALHLSLLSLGIGKGDEVITTPFSFIASSNSILYTGAKPVFVDIDPVTFNINPKLISKKITKKTKAILPVHLYGLPADMLEIMQIAKKNNLYVVEDACQAHGAMIGNKMVGSFGDMGCFSFYPTKNMTTGEGGIITTNDRILYEKLKLLRNHGMQERYHHKIIGYNFRMTNIAAAIGIEQIKKLDKFNSKRKSNAEKLAKELSKINGIKLPQSPKKYKHVFHQFTIRVDENFGISRDEVAKELKKQGIDTGIYYPIPIHKQTPYKGYSKLKLPESEKASKQVISLPIHPSIKNSALLKIIKAIRELSLNPKAKH